MKKDETPAGEARENPICGMGTDNITPKHNKGFSSFFCILYDMQVDQCENDECEYLEHCGCME